MRYRHLGNSGLEVSEIGLGTNNFGGRMDAAKSATVIDRAIDLGVNMIDTANIYSDTAIAVADTTVLKSDVLQVYSDTTILVSDSIIVESSVQAVEVDTGNIYSDTAILESESTVIQSDVALLEAARAEPGQGAPSASASLLAKIDYLYKAWRNKVDQTATEYKLYDDAGTTVDQKATVSDNGTTFSKGEVDTGP